MSCKRTNHISDCYIKTNLKDRVMNTHEKARSGRKEYEKMEEHLKKVTMQCIWIARKCKKLQMEVIELRELFLKDHYSYKHSEQCKVINFNESKIRKL